MTFSPRFAITPRLAKLIADIEVSRQSIAHLPITAHMLAGLRQTARLASTHYSTAIEGNRLSQEQVKEVIAGGGKFLNREKDEQEVRHYYLALDYVEKLAAKSGDITERQIQTIHGLAFTGREKSTPYRDGQNVIREGTRGVVVYIPPKAKDVPALMRDLIKWIGEQADNLPVPLLAGIAHYQFATIHPYYDGNGRTARLFATLLLHKYGYGMRGIYSLEEYYAKNLPAYYAALTVGGNDDYYEGSRAKADITGFLEYFISGMADSFAKVKAYAEKAKDSGRADQTASLRSLNPQQRQILKLFFDQEKITAKDIAEFFSVSARQARHLCGKWVEGGFLTIADPAPKTRSYRLAQSYEDLVQTRIGQGKE
jgi:Fic family protein